MTPDLIQQMLSYCEDTLNLTNWEEDFIESIRDQFDERGSLSERQAEILEKIYSEH